MSTVTSINFEASTEELISNITTVDHLEYTIKLLFEMVDILNVVRSTYYG
jgi:hypothetical protein